MPQIKFSFLFLVIVIFAFSGCATVPNTISGLPVYSLNNTSYLPLVSLCNIRGIKYDYDPLTKTVVLNKANHTVSLHAGDSLVLVDNQPQYLKYPVDIYKGVIVVPYKFKEQVIDVLFKESSISPKRVSLGLCIKKVIIDAGHGGTDPGAVGRSGLREKDVNLDIAKRLSNILKSENIEVVMTRNSDRFIPLGTRVDIANNSGANLFISIHSNANRVRSLGGFEVYYVSPSVSDAGRALISAKGEKLSFDKDCFSSNSLDLRATLWDMIYTSSRAESIELSRSICKSMEKNLNVRILGVKGARYQVLKGVHMPAVLIEVGFLSNGKEERMLANSYYRERIAESILEGISDYAKDFNLAANSN